jgi:hypothetical protein
MKNVRRIAAFAIPLLAWPILSASPARAQGPRADCYVSGLATATGTQITPGYDNRGLGFNVPCTVWHLIYSASNAATLNICASYAQDNGAGVPGAFTCAPVASGPTPLTSTTSQSSTIFTFAPWVNVSVSVLTGTGAGVRWQLLGWRPGPSNDSATQPNSSNITAISPLLTNSQALLQSFMGSFSFTNPANNAVLSNVFVLSPTKNIYFDKLVIASTAASTVLVNATNTGGSTCTAQTALNLNIGNNATHPPTATFNNQCGTPPGVVGGSPLIVDIPANTTVTIDLTGFLVANGTGSAGGIDTIQSGALTGVENVAIFWHEQ